TTNQGGRWPTSRAPGAPSRVRARRRAPKGGGSAEQASWGGARGRASRWKSVVFGGMGEWLIRWLDFSPLRHPPVNAVRVRCIGTPDARARLSPARPPPGAAARAPEARPRAPRRPRPTIERADTTPQRRDARFASTSARN